MRATNVYKLTAMVAFLMALLVAPPVYADDVICTFDLNCYQVGEYYKFCDETNYTLSGLGMCSLVDATLADVQCGYGGSLNITCTSDSDCVDRSLGRGDCNELAGICSAYSILGGPCILDSDCGSGRICRGGICSMRESQLACNSDATCEGGQVCIDETYCRNEGGLGAYCNKNSECISNQCSTDGVCVECGPTINDAPIGHYCEINANTSCDSRVFYKTHAGQTNVNVPRLEERVGENDECYHDRCCASNNCDPERGCLKAMQIGISPEESEYCNTYGYDLTNSWFDGVVSNLSQPPNLTVFETVFNKSNLTLIQTFNVTHADDGFSLWYRDASIVGAGYYIMTVTMYDTDLEEICYFRQIEDNIIWNCVDASSITAYELDSTHVMINESFVLFSDDDDFAIASSGTYYPSGVWPHVMWGYIFHQTSTSVYIDGVSFYRHDGGTLPTYLGFAYKLGVSTAHNSWLKYYNRYSGGVGPGFEIGAFGIATDENRTDDADVFSWSYGIGLPIGTSPTPTGIPRYIVGSYNNWGIHCESTPTNPLSGWADHLISGETDSEVWDCEDVPYIAEKENVNINIITSNTKYLNQLPICINESMTFELILRDDAGEHIRPEGTIYLSALNGGLLQPSVCSADGNPCPFIYTAPDATGRDDVTVTYSGDDDYNSATFFIPRDVRDDCNYVWFKVVDGDTDQPISGVTATPSDSSVQAIHTQSDGIVRFTSLSTTNYFNVTFSKQGYISYLVLVGSGDLNTPSPHKVTLTKISGGLPGVAPETHALPENPPTDSLDAITGLHNLTLAFFAYPFRWVLLFLIFLFAIGITKMLVDAVT